MAKLTLFKNFLICKKLKKYISTFKFQDWIKWTVLIICLVIVYFQLIDCCRKLNNPPVTTHTRLTLNDSMNYPALTICREPPYNKRLFPKFNFTTEHIGSFPYSSQWKYFPYNLYNISDFWDEAVYHKNVIPSYTLNQKSVDLITSIHLQSGMCYTIIPNFTVEEVGKRSGYSLLLNHDLYDYKPLVDEAPGWKIYVHEAREKFSENINFLSSRQDPIFVPVGELTEVSIDAYQFNVLRNCSNEESYSVTDCEENCTIHEDIEPYVQCSGPWFPSLNKPYCNEGYEMIDLIKATLSMKNRNCCTKHCKTTYYKIFIVKRTPCSSEKTLSSIAMIYFSSKTVFTMEERFSYTWNDFLGEIGGTVGFLLGLSIVGVIGILDKIIRFLFCQKEENTTNNDKNGSRNDSVMTRMPTVNIVGCEHPKV